MTQRLSDEDLHEIEVDGEAMQSEVRALVAEVRERRAAEERGVDEAAVDRAARALSAALVDDWEDIDWDTQEAYREDARAALAAALGGGQ